MSIIHGFRGEYNIYLVGFLDAGAALIFFRPHGTIGSEKRDEPAEGREDGR
jgi:hypothetical protein